MTTIITPHWIGHRPPQPGVYVASTERNSAARRYWDGRQFSAPWHVGDPRYVVERAMRVPADCGDDPIEWLMRP